MSEFKVKENTHLVIKREDIDRYLSPKEKDDFLHLDHMIASRKIMEEQKDPNSYYVVNRDEPYADKIFEAIKQGEIDKMGGIYSLEIKYTSETYAFCTEPLGLEEALEIIKETEHKERISEINLTKEDKAKNEDEALTLRNFIVHTEETGIKVLITGTDEEISYSDWNTEEFLNKAKVDMVYPAGDDWLIVYVDESIKELVGVKDE